MKNRLMIRLLCFSLILGLQPGLLIASPPQDDDTRGIWDSGFLKKRPKPASPLAAQKHIKYHRSTPKVFTSVEVKKAKLEDLQADKAVVGITFWKWRRSVKTDDKAVRILEREDDKSEAEWTPVRIESDTLFAPGDKVRLSFESPRDGYLYVIDRETYTDGSMGEPHLIFPTLKDYDGNNKVTAGRVIDIPRTKFVLKSDNTKYGGELLTFILTSKPIDGVVIPPRMVKLENAQVKGWEKDWGTARVEKYELEEGKGKAYTKAEKEAGEIATRLLTQEDDMPQTLFVLDTKAGNPILFTLQMKLQK